MSKLRERVKGRPDTFLLYGRPGIGKSELAANFKNPVFLVDPREDGVADLQDVGFVDKDIKIVEFATCDDYKKVLKQMIGKPYDTIVTETLGGLDNLIKHKVFKEGNFGTWKKFNNYAEGQRAMIPHYEDIIDLLTDLRDDGKTIIMTAHTDVTEKPNPSGENHMFGLPQCEKRCWDIFKKWFKNIYLMDIDFEVDEEGKAQDSGDRVIHVATNAAFEAKNRYRMVDPVEMGSTGAEAFKNLVKAIKEAKNS